MPNFFRLASAERLPPSWAALRSSSGSRSGRVQRSQPTTRKPAWRAMVLATASLPILPYEGSWGLSAGPFAEGLYNFDQSRGGGPGVQVAFRPGELPLECLVVALDSGDELGDFIALLRGLRRDLLTLAVVTADESHLGEKILGGVGDEVEYAVFLPDLGSEHGTSPR